MADRVRLYVLVLALLSCAGLARSAATEEPEPEAVRRCGWLEGFEAGPRQLTLLEQRRAKCAELRPYEPGFIERQILAFEKAERPAFTQINLFGLYPRIQTIDHRSQTAGGVRLWRPGMGGSALDQPAARPRSGSTSRSACPGRSGHAALISNHAPHIRRVVRVGARDLPQQRCQPPERQTPGRRGGRHAADRFAGSLDDELLAPIADPVQEVGEGSDRLGGRNPRRHKIRLSHIDIPGGGLTSRFNPHALGEGHRR
jgi:hypothetical protein